MMRVQVHLQCGEMEAYRPLSAAYRHRDPEANNPVDAESQGILKCFLNPHFKDVFLHM